MAKEEATRLRKFLAEKAGDFLRGLISREPVEMSAHTLVITATFKGDRSVIEKAVASGEKKAQSESSNGKMARVVFVALRMLGFGRIEATGEGSVETQEISPDMCEVKVVIGIMAEKYEKLVASSQTINQKVSLLPEKAIYKMLGVDPSSLKLIGVNVQVGNALPWTEQPDEGDIRDR